MIHIPKPRLGIQPNRKHSLSKGLVGCLLMNEKTGDKVFDSSIENNHSTNIGADWTPEGLYFGGTDRVSIPKVLINNNDAFTISATFFNTALTGIIYGEGYSGDVEWALFLGIEETSPYSARFLIKENNVWKAEVKGTTPVNDGWHTVSIVQKNKSYRSIYIDGELEGTNTDTVGDMSILDKANIGVLERSTFVSYFTGRINHLCIHNRAIADAEVKLYNYDPYKIFEPSITLVQLSTLLEGVTLTVEDLAGIGLLDNIILTQKHTLTVQELLSSGTLDSPTLTQKHLLVLQELLSAGVLDNVALIQKNLLSVQELSGTGSLNNVALTQKHILAVQELLSSGALDNVEVSIATLLVVAELLSSGTLDTADPIQKHILSIQDLSGAGVLDSPHLIQGHILAIQDLLSTGELDTADLTQKHLLAVQSLLSAGTLDNIELLLSTLLTVANMISVGTIDNIDPTQKHILSVDEVLSAGQLDGVALTQKNLLAIDDLISSGVIDNIQFDIATGLICITLTQATEYDISLTQSTEYNINLTQTGGVC